MKPPGLFAVLYRHFLAQLFENELLNPQRELRSGITGILAIACAALAALFVWLLMRRAELWREDPALLFQDGQAPAVQTLHLFQ